MKKNVASQAVGAEMITAADGTAFTSTVTVYVTGDAGTQAIGSVGSGVCTHEGNGFHTYAPAQAETNYNHVAFTFIGTGAIPTTVQIYTTFPQTGDNFARLGAPAGASVSADIADIPTVSEFNARTLAAASYFDPAADTVANVTTVTTATNLTNLPSIPANWITTAGITDGAYTAAKFAANSLDGKGDWNIGKTGYSLTATTGLGNQTANITGSLSGSVGSISGVTFPTNFADLSITVSTGRMDLGAVAGVAQAATNMEVLFDSNEGFYTAYEGPRGPGIYLNDGAANTSTTNGVDGTVGNPVSTIAAAKTLADSMSLDRFYLVNNTQITLAATMQEYEFVGMGDCSAHVVNMGDQIVTNSAFYNVTMEGDCSASSGRFYADNCILQDESGAGTSTFHIYAVRCGFLDSFRVTNNDDHIFEQCYSMVAGSGTPVIDLNSGASSAVNMRHYSGGIQIDNASITSVMSVETDGQVIVDATCNSGFTLVIRGNATVTDNASLSSLTQDAAYNASNVNAEVVDVITTDSLAEPTGVPAASDTLATKVGYLYMALRNQVDVTATKKTFYDDGGTGEWEKDLSDDGTTYSESEGNAI